MKQTMRAMLCLLLAFAMLASFSACGSKSPAANTDTAAEDKTEVKEDRMV